MRKIYPLLIFFLLCAAIPCEAVTVTPGVQFNLTNTSIEFQSNFTFDEIVVHDDTLCMYSDSWSNFTVIPTDEILINISRWNINGDYRKTWLEHANNSNTVTEHIITGYPEGYVRILRNSTEIEHGEIGTNGVLDWIYEGGYSAYVFDVRYEIIDFTEESELASTSVAMILVCVTLIMSVFAIGALRGKVEINELVTAVISMLVIMVVIYVIYGVATVIENAFSYT